MRLRKEVRAQRQKLKRTIIFEKEILDWLDWKIKNFRAKGKMIDASIYLNKILNRFYEADKLEMYGEEINVDQIIDETMSKIFNR